MNFAELTAEVNRRSNDLAIESSFDLLIRRHSKKPHYVDHCPCSYCVIKKEAYNNIRNIEPPEELRPEFYQFRRDFFDDHEENKIHCVHPQDFYDIQYHYKKEARQFIKEYYRKKLKSIIL